MKELICKNPVGMMLLAVLAGIAIVGVVYMAIITVAEGKKLKARLREDARYPKDIGI